MGSFIFPLHTIIGILFFKTAALQQDAEEPTFIVKTHSHTIKYVLCAHRNGTERTNKLKSYLSAPYYPTRWNS